MFARSSTCSRTLQNAKKRARMTQESVIRIGDLDCQLFLCSVEVAADQDASKKTRENPISNDGCFIEKVHQILKTTIRRCNVIRQFLHRFM
jgi:hypothetical protein